MWSQADFHKKKFLPVQCCGAGLLFFSPVSAPAPIPLKSI